MENNILKERLLFNHNKQAILKIIIDMKFLILCFFTYVPIFQYVWFIFFNKFLESDKDELNKESNNLIWTYCLILSFNIMNVFFRTAKIDFLIRLSLSLLESTLWTKWSRIHWVVLAFSIYLNSVWTLISFFLTTISWLIISIAIVSSRWFSSIISILISRVSHIRWFLSSLLAYFIRRFRPWGFPSFLFSFLPS